jgi:hypothetical protein
MCPRFNSVILERKVNPEYPVLPWPRQEGWVGSAPGLHDQAPYETEGPTLGFKEFLQFRGKG